MDDDNINFSDITEPNIVIPTLSESDTYFAPISPAANTVTSTISVSEVGSNVTSDVMSCGDGSNIGGTGSSGSVCVKPTLLLEMLQRGGQNQAGQGDATLPPIIRAPSIRDLGEQLIVSIYCPIRLDLEVLQVGLPSSISVIVNSVMTDSSRNILKRIAPQMV